MTRKPAVSFAFFMLILLGLFLVVRGQSLEIKGRVVSAEGKPVAKAVVLHRASGTDALSDEKGQFLLTLPVAIRVKLEIIHPDYLEEEVLLTGRALAGPIVIALTPYIRQQEEVVVMAMRYPEPSTKVPAASTVLSSETLAARIVPNIVEGLAEQPGMSKLGSGGFSLVPSVRGLSRRRVLLMIDNARLTSDRRTGPSASFINPEDIGRIEVLRSPSSVFYGSDAIGGVVHILTREAGREGPFKGKINARYGTVNREKGLGLSLTGSKSKLGYYLSFQGLDAENYQSPVGEVLQSQYTQASFFGKVAYRMEKRDVEGSLLLARGTNIGKPNRDSATKPTWYPRESQNLAQFLWREKGIWSDGELTFHLFANPNFLETRSEKKGIFKENESFNKTEGMDFGAQLSLHKNIFSSFRLTAGADLFGRSDVKAFNKNSNYDSQGNITSTFEETPYTDGRRMDFGVFVSGDYDGWERLDLVGGVRLDFLSSRAKPGGGDETSRTSRNSLTGFLAGSVKLSGNVIFFANLSRAYRAPDLSELYYSGITGRGFIIANPDLKPESSLNFDTGLKLIGKRLFAGLYGFSYDIQELIERYRIADRIYTYGNVDKGRIQGVELEWEVFPLSGWSVFGNASLFKGKSLEKEAPLNDVPPYRLFAGTRAWVGRFSIEVNGTIQRKKDDPGPAEVAIPGAQTANLKASYFFAPSLNIYFVLSNLFNKSYLGRPDPEAMEEPGRGFLFGIAYSF
ncbi:MAG: TonB-dependent receptor [Candidatus Aminicenantes bacterium]|nr:TonB-dependent receptor [Candidatus Aminicenantes bacterium]